MTRIEGISFGRGLLLCLAAICGAGLLATGAVWMAGLRPEIVAGLFWGVMIASVGAFSWYVPLRMTVSRPGQAFMVALLGGVVFRMMAYGGALILAALMGSVHLPALIIGLFGTHLLSQAAEILMLHRERGTRAAASLKGPAMAAILALTILTAVPAAAATGQAHGDPKEHAPAGQAHGDGAHDEHAFDVLHHVVNSTEMETPFGVVHLPTGWVLGGIEFAPTKHVVWMWIAGLLLLIFVLVAKRSTGEVSRGLGNFLETVVVFIRDEVARKNIAHSADKFTPYLCTLFFFILFCNQIGLVPWGATATGNLNMTAGLAAISLIMIQAAGIAENGVVAHVKALCPIPQGVPGWLLPLYIPIIIAVETVGIFAKPIALALRLFANMTAGHVVIVSLLGLIFILQSHLVAPVSVAFALFIYCLEVFVGFVQAYIFTMLTALFIGMSQHPAH